MDLGISIIILLIFGVCFAIGSGHQLGELFKSDSSEEEGSCAARCLTFLLLSIGCFIVSAALVHCSFIE